MTDADNNFALIQVFQMLTKRLDNIEDSMKDLKEQRQIYHSTNTGVCHKDVFGTPCEVSTYHVEKFNVLYYDTEHYRMEVCSKNCSKVIEISTFNQDLSDEQQMSMIITTLETYKLPKFIRNVKVDMNYSNGALVFFIQVNETFIENNIVFFDLLRDLFQQSKLDFKAFEIVTWDISSDAIDLIDHEICPDCTQMGWGNYYFNGYGLSDEFDWFARYMKTHPFTSKWIDYPSDCDFLKRELDTSLFPN